MFRNIQKLRNINLRHLSTCWKCGAENNAQPFCVKCNVIQKPNEKSTYFDLFGLPSTEYKLDGKMVTNKYRRLQSVLHPDKFANSSKEEKHISDQYSSLINKAYSTLQNPLDRAIHLLKINDSSLSEDEKISDPLFLAEMMELNEEIDDASESSTELVNLNEKNKNVLSGLEEEIGERFKKGDLSGMKESVVKLRYYSNIGKRINELLRQKGVVD